MKQTNINIFHSLMRTKFMAPLCAFAMFGLTACNVDNGLDLQKPLPNESLSVNPVPANNQVRTFTTTANGVSLLKQDSVNTLSGVNMAPTTIEIAPSQHKQTMEGFGYAITYSTAYNLLKMDKTDRETFLKRTFSPVAGYDFISTILSWPYNQRVQYPILFYTFLQFKHLAVCP